MPLVNNPLGHDRKTIVRALAGHLLANDRARYDALVAALRGAEKNKLGTATTKMELEAMQEATRLGYTGLKKNPAGKRGNDPRGNFLLSYLPYLNAIESGLVPENRGYGYGSVEEFYPTRDAAQRRFEKLRSANAIERAEIDEHDDRYPLQRKRVFEWKDWLEDNPAGKMNQPGYLWYVVFSDADGNATIESGWEYQEDAREHQRDNAPPGGKVFAKRTLLRHGVDPNDNTHWKRS